ncbi:MAG: sodium:solute symporter family transporter, partial [Planctomycetota bacterium]
MPQPDSESALKIIDWAIIGAYFVFTIWLGSYFSKRQTSSQRFFLGNRTLPGWAVGMSIFATIISSWAFLALPGKSFKDDMQYLLTIAPIPLTVLIAVLFIIPVFRQKIKLSAYEYLERRFGLVARFYGNIVFISGHFFKMGMVLFLLCLAIEGATGWGENYLTYLIIIVGIVTIFYTFFGGIEGVVWTHVIQGFLLLGGGAIGLLFLLFSSKAGPSDILATAYDAGKFKLANFDFDWNRVSVWMLLCFGFTHYLARYATDQTVVQRYVWVIFMFIGVLLWVYYKVEAGLLPPAVRQKPDQVFAYFIGHQIPAGVTGLILAGVFAAAMSTLSSDLNSLASVLADDFYEKLAKAPTDRRRLLFSRLSVIVAGIGAIFLALALRRVKSMVEAFF